MQFHPLHVSSSQFHRPDPEDAPKGLTDWGTGSQNVNKLGE
jgi:hypothetical protein